MPALALAETIRSAPQQSAGEVFPVAHKSAVAAWQPAVARRVGVGKEWSRAAFALRIGIGKSGVERWFDAETPSTPGFATFLSSARVLGPEFLNEAIAPSGMTGAYRASASFTSAPMTLTETLRLGHAFSTALEDQRIDEREGRLLAPMARALAARLSELAAQWERERS